RLTTRSVRHNQSVLIVTLRTTLATANHSDGSGITGRLGHLRKSGYSGRYAPKQAKSPPEWMSKHWILRLSLTAKQQTDILLLLLLAWAVFTGALRKYT
ncbi:MAG TPA: hypothetical protein VFU63_05000, partial [Ktedonobacterales bacterium]|nr:hypothetical protein [Ktedonobacterales bacterium]